MWIKIHMGKILFHNSMSYHYQVKKTKYHIRDDLMYSIMTAEDRSLHSSQDSIRTTEVLKQTHYI